MFELKPCEVTSGGLLAAIVTARYPTDTVIDDIGLPRSLDEPIERSPAHTLIAVRPC